MIQNLELPGPEEPPHYEAPTRRVRHTSHHYPRHPDQAEQQADEPPEDQVLRDDPDQDVPDFPEPVLEVPDEPRLPGGDAGQLPGSSSEASSAAVGGSSGFKREADFDDEEPPEKKSRAHLIEVFYAHLPSLAKQRQKKETKASDFRWKHAIKLERAILKEINNNLGTKAYELLSPAGSQTILRTKPEKVMESRYVITKKALEPAKVAKAESEGVLLEVEESEGSPLNAKCRHVMKGFSEEPALDVEFPTPEVNRDFSAFILQVLAGLGWDSWISLKPFIRRRSHQPRAVLQTAERRDLRSPAKSVVAFAQDLLWPDGRSASLLSKPVPKTEGDGFLI